MGTSLDKVDQEEQRRQRLGYMLTALVENGFNKRKAVTQFVEKYNVSRTQAYHYFKTASNQLSPSFGYGYRVQQFLDAMERATMKALEYFQEHGKYHPFVEIAKLHKEALGLGMAASSTIKADMTQNNVNLNAPDLNMDGVLRVAEMIQRKKPPSTVHDKTAPILDVDGRPVS